MIVFLVFLFLMAFIMVLTYLQAKSTIYQKNRDYSIELLDKIQQYIEMRVELTDGFVQAIAYSVSVQQYLKETDPPKKFELFQNVDSYITSLSLPSKGILDISILGKNGNNHNLMENLNKKQAVMETVADISGANYHGSKPYYAGLKQVGSNNYKETFFTLGTTINNVLPETAFGANLGYLVVLVDVNTFVPKFELGAGSVFGEFYLLDRNGIVSASNDTTAIGQKLDVLDKVRQDEKTFRDDHGEMYIVHQKELPGLHGQIVNVYSEKELYRGLEKTRQVYLMIIAIFIPILLLLLRLISRNIIGPIRTFMRYLPNLKGDRMTRNRQRLQLEGYQEIMLMADRFNELLDEIHQLNEEVVDSKTRIYSLELMKKQAEFAYLKHQVNPHFLYNMFETMKGMAGEIGATELREMLAALGKILRYSIKGQEEVRLQDELEVAKSYLTIQKFRFEGRFEIFYDFPEEILLCKVIKMILQPLLENAISHGLEYKMEKGHLHLHGQMTSNGDLLISIKDDGEGIPAEKLNIIHSELEGIDLLDSMRNNEHLGIMNVHHRIRTTYGEPYGLWIESRSGDGTEVTIKLPGRRDDTAYVQSHTDRRREMGIEKLESDCRLA